MTFPRESEGGRDNEPICEENAYIEGGAGGRGRRRRGGTTWRCVEASPVFHSHEKTTGGEKAGGISDSLTLQRSARH